MQSIQVLTTPLIQRVINTMEDLNEWCDSDELSLTTLRESEISQLSTNDVTQETYNENPLLHMICLNKNVTLEMIEYILDLFPGVASYQTDLFDDNMSESIKTTSYALHCACYNKHCPSSVIRLLYEEFEEATKWMAMVGDGVRHCDVKGLPLHYYLGRTNNIHLTKDDSPSPEPPIDMEIVKLLVGAYPQSLMIADDEEYACYPAHAVIHQDPNDLCKIIEYFLEVEPSSLRVLDGDGNTPLQLACGNNGLNLEVVQMLYNSWPEAIHVSSVHNELPIHELCCNAMLANTTALSILRFMLSIDPTLVRERDGLDYLPIHHAVRSAANRKSLEFCKVLIDLYPESLRVGTNTGSLPIHKAYDIEIAQYLLELYPESINTQDRYGMLPVHEAAVGRNIDKVELLLARDPDAASKMTNDESLPLHLACGSYHGYLEVVKALFDAFPQAIHMCNREGQIPFELASNLKTSDLDIINFLEAHQLAYAREANDTTAMETPDENGWLPLHHALKNKASLGSIKLLVESSPLALQVADPKGVYPLHIACEFSSVKIVKYLIGELGICLDQLDINKDSPLHYACGGGNLEVIKYFLDEYTSLVSLAEVNEEGELPIHLLCEAGKDKVDIDSTVYVETIWLMLLANPEVIMS